jgi:capsid protein
MSIESFTIDASPTSVEVVPAKHPDTEAAKSLVAKPNDRIQKLVAQLRSMQQARYDAATYTDEFRNYWVNADRFDADSANSREVRHTLISRSRYEATNNGYTDGIVQTYATDLVGNAPALRMQTASQGFNRMVEFQWYLWCKAIGFRRKLWTMAHAKVVDGESFAIMRTNPNVRHDINLDLVLYEAEQCQTPLLASGLVENEIDGIKFDQFGNPASYNFLRYHPGAASAVSVDLQLEVVPAELVLHWFKCRRPGQHRGVPELASTLNLGASFRRLREANLSTAEKVAAWTLFLKTMFQPTEEDAENVESLEQLEIVRGMITTLPNTVEPFQLKAEHPGPQYDSFHKTTLNEQARPKNMPYNKAACDSSSYNYASGRLDHQTYYGGLDVDREDCNDAVLNPLFDFWFALAVKKFNWLGGDISRISPGARVHIWDWPKHRVADIEAEANANRTKLESGQILHPQLMAEQGVDFDDFVEENARKYRITEDELVSRLLDVALRLKAEPAPAPPPVSEEAVSAALRHLDRRGVIANVN